MLRQPEQYRTPRDTLALIRSTSESPAGDAGLFVMKREPYLDSTVAGVRLCRRRTSPGPRESAMVPVCFRHLRYPRPVASSDGAFLSCLGSPGENRDAEFERPRCRDHRG